MKLTDYNLKNTTSYDNGYGNILLVGILENGPIGQPFTITSNQNIFTLLGDNPTTRYANYLINNGIDKDKVIYYRINGKNSRYRQKWETETVFDFIGIDGSDNQNNIFITFSQEGLTIHSNYEDENSFNYKRTYLYEEYPYTSQLANAINEDAVLGLIDVITKEYLNVPTRNLFTLGEVKLSEGDKDIYLMNKNNWSEEDKKLYFEMFQKHVLGEGYETFTQSNIINVHAEMIMYPDIFLEDFILLAELSAFVSQQKTDTQQTMCYSLFKTKKVPSNDINIEDSTLSGKEFMIQEKPLLPPKINPFTEGNLITPKDMYEPYQRQLNYVNRLANLFDSNKQGLEHFKYLMVAVGQQDENIFADLPLAILISKNEPNIGLSNKQIDNFILENPLPRDMLAILREKGYTYIVPSVRKKFVFEKVQSMDLYKEDRILKEWSNQRLFNHISYSLGLVFDNHIGQPMNYLTKAIIEEELIRLFSNYIKAGRLKHYQINTINFSAKDNYIDINIELSFNQEINQVKGMIAINKDGWDIDIWNLTE